jgi:DNA-binding NtrC family response regulator
MIAIELEWENYRLLCAADATQALELLAENAVNVVVSDVMMPGMKGTDFLSRVHRLYPETLRIMLSGHGDMDTVVTAVNSGAIYRYLEKPVNGGVLRRTLREALTLCDMRDRRSEPSLEASAPGRAHSAVDQSVATA